MVLFFCSLSGCNDSGVQIRTYVTEDGGTGKESEEASEESSTDSGLLKTEKTEAAAAVVHVCGAVEAPGVYTLPEGSRVADAVKAAGGVRTDAAEAAVNLAREITDGEQIYIPTIEEWEDGQASGSDASAKQGASGSDGKVDINHADAGQLTTLPGIGATRAADIIAYRDAHGSFGKIEDLMKVPGIKEGTYQKLKDHICVN